MLAEAQGHPDFFIAKFRLVRSEVFWKIALVVACPPTDGALEKPFADSIFWTTAPPANRAEQRRDVNGIADTSGQRRVAQLFKRFHATTLAWLL